MNTRLQLTLGFVLLHAFMVFNPGAARAASLFWDGSSNHHWTNSGNWDLGVWPTNGDSLHFPPGPNRLSMTNIGNATKIATNFRSFTFTGSNYFLYSNPLSLTNGLTNAAAFDSTNAIGTRLILRASQFWDMTADTVFILSSNVSLTNLTLNLSNDGLVQFDGPLNGGAGSVIDKTGAGRVEINGAATLTQLNVQDGALEVNGSLSGSLAVAAGTTLQGTGSLSAFTCAGTISPGGTETGVLTCLGTPTWSAGSVFQVNLNGATPGTGYDQFRVASSFGLGNCSLFVLPGYLPQMGDSFVIITNTGAGNFSTTFIGRPEGSTQTVSGVQYRINYAGGSGNDVTLTVVGFNALSTTAIWDGEGADGFWLNALNWSNNVAPLGGENLLFPAGAFQKTSSNNFPAGTPFNSIIFQDEHGLAGAPFAILGTLSANGGLVRITNALTFQPGAVSTARDTTLHGPVTLEDIIPISTGAGVLTIAAEVSGSGGFDVSGELFLTRSNSYTGATRILDGGIINVTSTNGLGAASPGGTTVASNGWLRIGVPASNTEPLLLAGRLRTAFATTWTSPVVLSNRAAEIEVAGFSNIFAGPVTGSNVLVRKTGSGLLVFAADNALNGAVTVDDGALQVNGLSSLNVTNNDGFFSGTGTVANITAPLGGIVRPGLNRSGVLTCSNFLVTASAPLFYVDVSATGNNQLRARGNVQLNGNLIVATVGGPALGVPFTIIDNEGPTPVLGTFLALPEGASITFSGLTYRVSYAGGDGNDVTLELINVASTGVTRLWDAGGVNNFWSNPANWSGDTLPELGDSLQFPANLGASDFLTTNDLPAGMIFDQLIVRDGAGGPGTVLHGNAITLLHGVLATNTADGFRVQLPLQLVGAQTFALSVPPFTFGGPITLNGDLTFGGNSNVSISVTGAISGAGGIIKTCPGGLTLNGNNSFDGPVQILNGSLTVGHASALGAPGGGTFTAAGTALVLAHTGGLLENFLSITGSVSVITTNTVLGQIELPNAGTSFNAGSASRLTLAGRLTGAGGPLFQGGGTFALTGTNDCAADTLLQSSTLLVHGRSVMGELSVNSPSATLGGTGVVGRISMGNGTLNPGASAGLLSTSNLTSTSSSVFRFELNGPNAATDYDQLNVTGTIFLGSPALVLSFGVDQVFGTAYTLMVNDGVDAISGTFAGLPEGATFTTNGMTFRISYTGGTGNDVTLTRVLAATGVTRIWDGGGANAAWSNRFNWVGDLAPVEGDDLFFPSVAVRKNNTNDFPAFFGFNSLTVADGYVLGAAGVTLNAGIITTNSGGVTLNLPVLLNTSQSNFVANGTTLTLNNGVNLSTHTLTWGVEGQLNLSGQLTGSGGLLKTGGGAVSLSGTNTLIGTLEFRGGSVSVLNSNVFGSASGATIVGAGTLFQFNSAVTVAEPFVLNGLNASAVTMQFVSGTSTLAGPITLGAEFASVRFNPQAGEVRLNGVLNGGSLSKEGAGRLVLNGSNLHTNVTALNAGTLIVNGSQPASVVEISGAGSILGGTGVTARVRAFGGTLSPGASPGRLTFLGGLTNNATVTNFFELDGPAPGSAHDQIVVAGNIGLNGSVLRLNFGYSPAFGETFTLIDNQGLNPVGGTFAGLPEGAWLTNGAVVTRLTYQGGTGNDVVLTRIAVPTGLIRIWDGGGADNLWSNPVNWAGDLMPQPGDDVVLPGTVAKAPHFDAGTNIAYNTLLLGRAYSITAATGNSMRLINSLTTTNATGIINLHPGVTLENNQLWSITHPGAQLIQRGPVNLGLSTLTHVGAGGLSFTARVTGGGGLSGNSSGILSLGGTNDFTGTVTVNSGILEVQSPGALGSTLAGTFVGTAGRLSMGLPDGGAIDEPITLAGRVDVVLGVTNIWNGPVILAGTQTAFDTLNAGGLMVNGPLFGGGWQTLGIGSLVLNSPASYGGPFRVGGGARVFVNENHSAVFFALTNSGILGGTGVVGQIAATTCTGCEINPGPRSVPGVLRSSSITLASGATLRARVNGPVAGTGYDQLDVTGTVTLTGASLVVTAGFNPGTGVSFTLINNDGADPVNGTFSSLPQDALLVDNGVSFRISYTGGDGNDVVLTRVTAAPPSTIQPVVWSNGVPVLTGVGVPNAPYVLEAAPHLNAPIPWQPILTNNSDGAGVYEFHDFVSTNFPMRFYRVLSP